MKKRTVPRFLLILAMTAVAACASSQAGRRIEETSADRTERLSGITLGSVGDVAHLHKGEPWIPSIGLCRRWKNGRDVGNVFLATVVLAGEPFGFDHLAVKEHGLERSLPGRILGVESRPGLYEPRFTERFEVELADEDVRRFVAAGASLELRMEGDGVWIKVPPGPALESALTEYRDHFLPVSANERSGDVP